MRKKCLRDKGITLIALVVTVIVLLILAGVTINIVMGNNGIFEKGKRAARMHVIADEKEQITLAYGDCKMELISSNSGDIIKANDMQNSLNVKKKDNTTVEDEESTNNLKITFTKTRDKFKINQNGEFLEEPKVGEAKADSEDFKDDEIKDIKTAQSGYAENTEIVKDDNNDKFYLPAGFKVSSDTATKIEDGIVIEDKSGNQFVWISVDGSNIKYERKSYDGKNITTTYTESLNSFEESSVNKYKGYYIGRYEAGIESGVRTDATVIENAVVKANQNVYNQITRDNALIVAEEMISNDNVQTRLCSSYAWDTALSFISSKAENSGYATKSTIDNNKNNEVKYLDDSGTEQTKASGVSLLLQTGKTKSICNIYDFAGNACEWTTESQNDDTTRPYTFRGGYFNNTTDAYPTGARNPSKTGTYNKNIGFRVAMFIKESPSQIGKTPNSITRIRYKDESGKTIIVPITASNVTNYYGWKITNYSPSTDTTGTYRIFYFDANGDYSENEEKNVLYLKRDWEVNNMRNEKLESAPLISEKNVFNIMNSEWYSHRKDATNLNSNEQGAIFNLADPTRSKDNEIDATSSQKWVNYLNPVMANYTIGSPSLEMYCKSYNSVSHSSGNHQLGFYYSEDKVPGYYFIQDNIKKKDATDMFSLDYKGYNSMYCGNKGNRGEIDWVLCSPSASEPWRFCFVDGYDVKLYSTRGGNYYGTCPIVCLKNGLTLDGINEY